VLLLATVALTGCRFAEHGRRAAIDAFASFVFNSVSQAPLTQAAPAKASRAAASPAAGEAPRRGCPIALAATAPAAPAALPFPQPRIVSIDLAPAAARIARVKQIVICTDLVRARLEARMALAELQGARARRIVVLLPEINVPEPPPAPATL
jgi:hypothetical protein